MLNLNRSWSFGSSLPQAAAVVIIAARQTITQGKALGQPPDVKIMLGVGYFNAGLGKPVPGIVGLVKQETSA
jgi:hypothetical protein